jgi:hypothetical protein
MTSHPGERPRPGGAILWLIVGLPLALAAVIASMALAKRAEVRREKARAAAAAAEDASRGR